MVSARLCTEIMSDRDTPRLERHSRYLTSLPLITKPNEELFSFYIQLRTVFILFRLFTLTEFAWRTQ